jgi:hypothetical protein
MDEIQNLTDPFDAIKDSIHQLSLMPHYVVTAQQRHKINESVWKIIHDRSYHEKWEARTIANMIQQNFLKSKNDKKYDQYYFNIDINNDFTLENYYWDTTYNTLEFKDNSMDDDEELDITDITNN